MRTLEEKFLDTGTIRKKSWIAFFFFFLSILGGIIFWIWLNRQPLADGALWPLRSVMNTNENIFTLLINDRHKAASFPLSQASPRVRVNGDAGMGDNFDTASWKLQVIRKPGDTLFISLEEIKALPKTEIIFDFKCIEGWSQLTHWAGVKFSDFVEKYHLEEQSKMSYVGMNTPDKKYYVGIDRKSIMHPQTILCYEMNGSPLPMNQGYPLRLIIPVKYGIKHLKRIGILFFSNTRPPDYWFERGYDYFSGL